MSEHETHDPRPEKRHFFDNPRNVRLLIGLVAAACLASVVAQFFVHVHVTHPWETLFAFYGLYGFVAFVALVLLAKEVLRRLVMRRKDYYDD
jgi:uncharacterized membrane protein